MSWKASGYVKEITGVTRSEKLLLLLLGDYYDESRGWAWPSIKRLSVEGMMSERHVIRLLQSLERRGVIEILRGGGITNRYRFPKFGTSDMVSPVTSDVTPPVTSDVTQTDIEPTGMVITGENQDGRVVYDTIVRASQTQSGVHSSAYWRGVKSSEWTQQVSTQAVVEAVGWVKKSMGVQHLTLPTPPYLANLSRLGNWLFTHRARPDDLAIVTTVPEQYRVQDRLLTGVSVHMSDLISQLVQRSTYQ